MALWIFFHFSLILARYRGIHLAFLKVKLGQQLAIVLQPLERQLASL